jgi:hypothetical protein
MKHLKVPAWITDKELTPNDIKLVVYIISMSTEGTVRYRPTRWCKTINMSRPTILKTVNKLIRLGYMGRVKNPLHNMDYLSLLWLEV